MKKTLITGSAGFIGHHTTHRLIVDGYQVTGLDSINKYYDPDLKFARLYESGIQKEEVEWGKALKSSQHNNYTFYRLELEDKEALLALFEKEKFDYVIHLAAQAGVRYSVENPDAYIGSNVQGFLNILEACRHFPVQHLVYASSSSVYGSNLKTPFSEYDNTDHPISLYAATKKANEMMAHAYSQLYDIPVTGLRFFTVYGPWGRPDMALFLFTKAIIDGEPIQLFNNGYMVRDFTYIDDIVEGIVQTLKLPAQANEQYDHYNPVPATSNSKFRLFNIGNSSPIQLLDFIEVLEEKIGRKAIKKMFPMQPGDVPGTWADVTALHQLTGYSPKTPIKEGINAFVDWYRRYYGK
jgi:UDP-glucuronate 4-epimerase